MQTEIASPGDAIGAAKPLAAPPGNEAGADDRQTGASSAQRVAIPRRGRSVKIVKRSERRFVARSYADIEESTIRWGWGRVFPRGMLSAIVGEPGQGKSLVTCDLVARFTQGLDMPCGGVNGFGKPVNVLILAMEDTPSDTIKPRLRAAGANMERVFDLEMRVEGQANERGSPLFPSDLTEVGELVKEQDIRVIVVDPITAYLSEDVNAWKTPDVRRALGPLMAIAEKNDAVVLLVMHLNKSQNATLLNKVGESKAFVAVPRMVWVVAPDPWVPSHTLMVSLKANVGPKKESYGFCLTESETGPNSPPIVAWDSAPGMVTSKDLEESAQPQWGEDIGEGKQVDIICALARLLRNGDPVPSEVMKQHASTLGVSTRTLQRHAEKLGVKFERTATVPSTGTWSWPVQDE